MVFHPTWSALGHEPALHASPLRVSGRGFFVVASPWIAMPPQVPVRVADRSSRIVGSIHGLLFLLFVSALFRVATERAGHRGGTLAALGASARPLRTFFSRVRLTPTISREETKRTRFTMPAKRSGFAGERSMLRSAVLGVVSALAYLAPGCGSDMSDAGPGSGNMVAAAGGAGSGGRTGMGGSAGSGGSGTAGGTGGGREPAPTRVARGRRRGRPTVGRTPTQRRKGNG
jgi:hypothetical protein